MIMDRMGPRGVRVGVVQDGARLHYGLPAALKTVGMLDRVYTDWYSPPGSFADFLGRAVEFFRPDVGRRMRERHHHGLSGDFIRSAPLRAVSWRLARCRFSTPEAYFEWHAERVAQWILSETRLDKLDVLMGFVGNMHPRLIEAANARGIAVIGDQIIAPATVWAAEAASEAALWPGWEPPDESHNYGLVAQLERESWVRLDHITCGSEYVRNGLIVQGVSADKVTVLPYPDVPAAESPARSKRTGRVTVGFVGAVGMRKGAPYFFAVAKQFDPRQVRFIMVGPVHISPAVVEREKGSVELVGAVCRSEVRQWLSQFDIFLFPSTCEGSAGAVVEALGAGLPVVTTTNSGTTVRDGIDGFVLEPRDVNGLTQRVRLLVNDDALRSDMSKSAYSRHSLHHPARYADGVAATVRRALNTTTGDSTS